MNKPDIRVREQCSTKRCTAVVQPFEFQAETMNPFSGFPTGQTEGMLAPETPIGRARIGPVHHFRRSSREKSDLGVHELKLDGQCSGKVT